MPSDSTANSALNPVQSKGAGLIPAQPSDSPLDFIQRNLKKNTPAPNSPKENITSPEPTASTTSTTSTAPEIKADIKPADKKDEVSFVPDVVELPKGEPAKTPAPPAGELDFEGEVDIPPEAQNFKKLRTKYKETSKTLKERDVEAEALRTKIKKYEEGEDAPEYVNNLKKRLTELEPLEQIHKLKTSDAYKTKVIEPLAEKTNALLALAKDYEISDEVITQASEITNTRELNQFLLNHFDEVGALEAKQQITAIQKIKTEAVQAENSPKEALSKMESEHRSLLAVRDAQRKNSIADTAKGAWSNSIRKIIESGRVQELIPRENDPDFNEKYPYAIQQKAATEYGRIVRELADAGLTKLSPELSEALATASLLSHASAVAVARANAAEDYAAEIQRNAERSNRYSRPNLGASGGGGGVSSAPKGPISTQEAARNLMANVLAKKA